MQETSAVSYFCRKARVHMKNAVFYIFCLFACLSHAQVGINTSEPNPGAALDISSAEFAGGLIIPTVTVAQRDNITADANDEGLMVFVDDGTTNCLQSWDGAAWRLVYCQTVNTAPEALSVAISGTPADGNTLNGTYTYDDADGDTESGTTFQWYRADDAAGTNSTAIAGATSQSYTVVTGDVGDFIAFAVTPAASSGASPGTETFSAYEGPVTAASTFTEFRQDFDSQTNWNYTLDPASFNTSGDVWDVVSSLGGLSNVSGNFWGMQDLTNNNGGRSTFLFMEFDQVDVSGGNNVEIRFDWEVIGYDNGDDMQYEVFFDGVSQGVSQFVDGASNLNDSGTITIIVPNGTGTVSLIMGADQNGGGDYGSWDNFRIIEN